MNALRTASSAFAFFPFLFWGSAVFIVPGRGPESPVPIYHVFPETAITNGRSAGEKQGKKQISDPLDNYPVGVYNPYRVKHTPVGYFGRLRYGWNDESVLRFGAEKGA